MPSLNHSSRAAEMNGRSMNSEIVDCLLEKFPADPSDSELLENVEYLLAIIRNTPTPKVRVELVRALQEAADKLAGERAQAFRNARHPSSS